MNVRISFSVTAAVLHVSAPYSRACFTVVLKILIFMLMVRLGRPRCSSLEEGCSGSANSHFSPVSVAQWNLSHLVIHIPPVLWALYWLLPCSWGHCSYACRSSDQDGLSYLSPCRSPLASIAGYGRGEPGHLQSPGHQVGFKESTEFRLSSGRWMSSTLSRWPVGIGKTTAGILVSPLSLLERHLSVADHRPLCMSFHCRSF